jgi:hypothetical protein
MCGVGVSAASRLWDSTSQEHLQPSAHGGAVSQAMTAIRVWKSHPDMAATHLQWMSRHLPMPSVTHGSPCTGVRCGLEGTPTAQLDAFRLRLEPRHHNERFWCDCCEAPLGRALTKMACQLCSSAKAGAPSSGGILFRLRSRSA